MSKMLKKWLTTFFHITWGLGMGYLKISRHKLPPWRLSTFAESYLRKNFLFWKTVFAAIKNIEMPFTVQIYTSQCHSIVHKCWCHDRHKKWNKLAKNGSKVTNNTILMTIFYQGIRFRRLFLRKVIILKIDIFLWRHKAWRHLFFSKNFF